MIRHHMFAGVILSVLALLGCPPQLRLNVSATAHAFGATPTPWTFEIWAGGIAIEFEVSSESAWVTITQEAAASAGPDDRVAVQVEVVPDNLEAGCNRGVLNIRWGEAGTLPETWQTREIPINAVGIPALDGCDPVTVTVEIPADRDGTLYQTSLTPLEPGLSANGAGEFFFAGRTPQNLLRRAVIHFDIAGEIPEEATIKEAILILYSLPNIVNTGSQAVELYRVARNWGEGTSNAVGAEETGAVSTAGDATWKHTFYPGQVWTALGGDITGAARASQNVTGEGTYRWNNANLAADVQDWLDKPQTNFGWLIFGNEKVDEPEGEDQATIPNTLKRFCSRENATESQQPVLKVTYEYLP